MADPRRAVRVRGSPDYYFDSYSYLQIHEDMLKDTVRTGAYRDALSRNPSLLVDKVVLDVGCGTGILSMFAARAGARKVYGVENSGIVEFARMVIEENGLSEKITIIQGVMEEVEIPERVDLVVSEWMGYALLFESMLPSVISARDRFMKPGGTMFPNIAHLYLAGVNDPGLAAAKFDYWNDVHGFDFSPIRRWVLNECLVQDVADSKIVTSKCMIAEIDLNTVTVPELTIQRSFELRTRNVKVINAIVLWFDVVFSGGESRVELSTSPYSPSTHWSQTLFYFAIPIHANAAGIIKGQFKISPNERNPRDQDITFNYRSKGKKRTRVFKLR
jgi:protein arginine N-methyltransferase 1